MLPRFPGRAPTIKCHEAPLSFPGFAVRFALAVAFFRRGHFIRDSPGPGLTISSHNPNLLYGAFPQMKDVVENGEPDYGVGQEPSSWIVKLHGLDTSWVRTILDHLIRVDLSKVRRQR